MTGFKFFITICSAILTIATFTSCGSSSEKDQTTQTDDTCKSQILKPVKPDSAYFYIETSAGMKGYFPNGDSSKYKKHLYEAIKEFKGTISYLSNDGRITNQKNNFDIGTFSKENFSGTTHLIKMLKTIVTNDTIKDGVSVFVSDLRYDPKEKGQEGTNDKLSVYQSDLGEIFDSCKNNGRAISLICATSNFNDGKNSTDKSPYYYLVIGKAEQVAFTRNKIIEILGETYVAYYEAGMDYQSLSYSYASPKSKDNCQIIGDNKFLINDGSKSCTITIKIDDILSIFPYLKTYLENCKKEDFSQLWNFNSNNRVVCNIEDYQINDKSLIITLKAKVAQMGADSAEITWKLNDIPFNIPAFEAYYTDDYNGGNEDPGKSYSVDKFIEKMKEYPNAVDTSEHKIVISKSK